MANILLMNNASTVICAARQRQNISRETKRVATLMSISSPRPKKKRPYAQKHLQVVPLKLLETLVSNVAVAAATNEKRKEAPHVGGPDTLTNMGR